MPIYEYECEICRHYFEKLVQDNDKAPDRCPQCGGRKITKLLSGTRLSRGSFAKACGTDGSGKFR